MAIIKCKMCGGDLKLVEGVSTAECEFCGSVQTVPKVDDEKKLTLFGRANRLRTACDFDKAAGIYETIVADFPEEAEAYWGLVLCKYGIEYVDDPGTGRKIPTCHRSNYDSVLSDDNYEQAVENADISARRLYRDEARTIEELRKRILEVSSHEEPYDIFICYKETAVDGGRTLDSVLAQDIYDALTEKRYRVFFSRVTLEEKLGQEYEPYIFAALNSAKVMLVVGTDYEHFNAVWVKNEWSRFLQLMAGGQKKSLIPCYKNMDPYDMPQEFARLQAQDMSKIGAMQDLLRGIDKILPKQESVQQVVTVQAAPVDSRVPALMDRGNLALEDGEWENADKFFDEVLNFDARNAHAYVGKFCAEMHIKNIGQVVELDSSAVMYIDGLPNGIEPGEFMNLLSTNKVQLVKRIRECSGWGLVESKQFMDETERKIKSKSVVPIKSAIENSGNFQKALRFADPALKAELQKHLSALDQKKAEKERDERYNRALKLKETGLAAGDEGTLKQAVGLLRGLPGYRDADRLRSDCEKGIEDILRAKEEQRRKQYEALEKTANESNDLRTLENAVVELQQLDGYRDSERLVEICREKLEVLRAKLEKERQAKAAAAREAEKEAKALREQQEAIKEKNNLRLALAGWETRLEELRKDRKTFKGYTGLCYAVGVLSLLFVLSPFLTSGGVLPSDTGMIIFTVSFFAGLVLLTVSAVVWWKLWIKYRKFRPGNFIQKMFMNRMKFMKNYLNGAIDEAENAIQTIRSQINS